MPCPVSVLILTRNEEHSIAACIACLSFSDDIVVLDSCSTDRTTDIAGALEHVRVVQRAFDTEQAQRGFGLHEIPYRHRWVYVCDADERVPEELAAEILEVCGDATATHAAYRLRFDMLFDGGWIKHASGYPVWVTRLVRPDRVGYEDRQTHVHSVVDGTTGALRSHFVHRATSGGLARWLRKHNDYSSAEAIEAIKVRRNGFPRPGSFFSTDPLVRRRAFKNASYFLDARPRWRFFYCLVICSAWRDGAPGLRYAALIALYEYWIALKIDAQLPGGVAEAEHDGALAAWHRIDQDIALAVAEASGSDGVPPRLPTSLIAAIASLCRRRGRWAYGNREAGYAIPSPLRNLIIEMLRRERSMPAMQAPSLADTSLMATETRLTDDSAELRCRRRSTCRAWRFNPAGEQAPASQRGSRSWF